MIAELSIFDTAHAFWLKSESDTNASAGPDPSAAHDVQMRGLLNGTEGFAISDRVPDWEALIRDSDFHLCPRGNGPTSYRMYESLQAETIPIYIWAEVGCSVNRHTSLS